MEFTLYELKVGRNVTFYLEEDKGLEKFQWDSKFESEKHKCTVIFNDPRKILLSLETPDYCFEL